MLPLLLHYAALAVAALVVVAVPYALRLVARRTKPGYTRDALLLLTELVGIGVRAAAGAVAALKDPTQPGAWGAAAAAAVKARVIADAKAAEPAAVQALAAAAGDPAQVDALLARLVESELAKFKASAPPAAPPASAR